MAVPSIYKIEPFDATVGTTITYSWNGSRNYGYDAYIYQEGVDSVYIELSSGEQPVYKCEFAIPANAASSDGTLILTNDKTYRIKVRSKDKQGEYSDWSDYKTFLCIKEPTFDIQGLKGALDDPDSVVEQTNNLIQASNIEVAVHYFQNNTEEEADGVSIDEQLNIWKALLYDSSRTLIDYSNDLYYSTNSSYSFSGLRNDVVYYIRATGETVNGKQLDTGYYKVQSEWVFPNVFTNIEVYNNPEQGNIHVSSNIIPINGQFQQDGENSTDITWVEGNGVDLRKSGDSVLFAATYGVDDEYTLLFEGNSFNQNSSILLFEDDAIDDSGSHPVLLDVQYRAADNTSAAAASVYLQDISSTSDYYHLAVDITSGTPDRMYILAKDYTVATGDITSCYLIDEADASVTYLLGVNEGKLFIEAATPATGVATHKHLILPSYTISDAGAETATSTRYKLAVDSGKLYLERYVGVYIYATDGTVECVSNTVTNVKTGDTSPDTLSIAIQKKAGALQAWLYNKTAQSSS